MRLAKRFHLLLLLSLSLGLFCGELPELFSLTDDAANDFVAGPVTPVMSDDQVEYKGPESAPWKSPAEDLLPDTSALHPLEPTLPGPDLLRSLSIQRK
jgi:hypothetical protein